MRLTDIKKRVNAINKHREEYSLVYFTNTYVTDGNGNEVPTKTPDNLMVYLVPESNPDIVQRYGVDDKTIVLSVRLKDPLTIPADVFVGQTFDLMFNAMPGVLTIRGRPPENIINMRGTLGESFIGTWVSQ